MRISAIVLGILMFFTLAGVAPAEEDAIGRTPPRLSFVDGQVSFWRPGAQDWVKAQVNTALAPGDQLYAGPDGNFELQIGPRAYVRGGAETQIGVESHEPDFLQFKVTTGNAAFDLRTVEAGRTVEVDTPNAAFTMDLEGYYRVGVNEDRTSFTTRRGGQASATPAGSAPIRIGLNETMVLDGTAAPTVASQGAVPLDSWDQWNYDRSGQLLEAASARYVAPDTYGLSDLDHYGSWRTVPSYGPVWRPSGVSAGWAPYSTGAWMRDPYYGWTWVDTAPWGWAPYHYGRWVHVNGYWCWAPGPRVVRPVYAPALVAFFGLPGVQVSVNIGRPSVGWVSLGWGEPLVPWWGRPGFIHRPWWGGWGGPRHINNRVVHHTTVVHVHQINHYHNTRFSNAMVVVDRDRFGRGPIRPERIDHSETRRWRPTHAAPEIAAAPESYVPNTRSGRRPSEKHLQRPVVSSRSPRHDNRFAPGKSEGAVLQRDTRPGTQFAPGADKRRLGVSRPEAEPQSGSGRPPAASAVEMNERDRKRGPQSAPTSGPEPGQGRTPNDRPRFESPRTPRPPDMPRQPVGRGTENGSAAGPETTDREQNRRERPQSVTGPAQPDRPAVQVPRTTQPPDASRREVIKGYDQNKQVPQLDKRQPQERPQHPQSVNEPQRRKQPAGEAPRISQPPVTPRREIVKSYGPGSSAPQSDRRQIQDRMPRTSQENAPVRFDRSAPGASQDRSLRQQRIEQPRVSPQIERVMPAGPEAGAQQRIDQKGLEERKRINEEDLRRRQSGSFESR